VLPALGGKTPRQAARSRRGREELALLLKDLENREAHQPATSRFDVNVLRRAQDRRVVNASRQVAERGEKD